LAKDKEDRGQSRGFVCGWVVLGVNTVENREKQDCFGSSEVELQSSGFRVVWDQVRRFEAKEVQVVGACVDTPDYPRPVPGKPGRVWAGRRGPECRKGSRKSKEKDDCNTLNSGISWLQLHYQNLHLLNWKKFYEGVGRTS